MAIFPVGFLSSCVLAVCVCPPPADVTMLQFVFHFLWCVVCAWCMVCAAVGKASLEWSAVLVAGGDCGFGAWHRGSQWSAGHQATSQCHEDIAIVEHWGIGSPVITLVPTAVVALF